ncbi:hypothetical protein J2J97_32280 (plasmid) [Rhizobium bangladeshense]|uniref:hypothetical protein n=1 Tax=Rhizobium bangladeshense TaxID=1138189 RepID=UPI001A986637|nr:hypothetical protein [Rhizobium bangladeshense]QSY98583.1 hypothetical protein J2J97_32280 [Rhizobium bangladeshense]
MSKKVGDIVSFAYPETGKRSPGEWRVIAIGDERVKIKQVRPVETPSIHEIGRLTFDTAYFVTEAAPEPTHTRIPKEGSDFVCYHCRRPKLGCACAVTEVCAPPVATKRALQL